MNKKKVGSSMLLLLTAVIWGVAFVAQSVAADIIQPFTFNFIRFLMGGLFLLPFLFVRRHFWKKETAKKAPVIHKTAMLGGIVCGICLSGGSMCQQYGIQFTSVGKAGFITALYIIMVPIFGIFLKKRISILVGASAVVAVIGFYLLCMTESLSINKGDLFILLGSVIFTLHILVIDYYSPKADGVTLSCVQFFTSAVICAIGTFLWEKPTLPAILEAYIPLLYAGILSCGVAYTLQIIGQRNTEPAVASLILSLESVIAALAGWLILGQRLTLVEMIGCLLVFTAIIMAQLPIRNH